MTSSATPKTSTPGEPSTIVKTRILIISDTHNATLFPENSEIAFRKPLPKADVLLHCGDLTMLGHLHEYEQTMGLLGTIDAPLKLVIAGNHDISLDQKYWARNGQYMHKLQQPDPTVHERAINMWKGEAARKAGVTYLEEGTHLFTLTNGAKLRVYASPYQPEFCDFAFPYWHHEDRYNPPHQCTPSSTPIAENPVPDFPAIDIMMTHGPPKGIRDETPDSQHVGCEHLLRAVRRCKPRLHCFGHIHEGWGAENIRWEESDDLNVKWDQHVAKSKRIIPDNDEIMQARAAHLDASASGGDAVKFGKETLMVNASIMTIQYRPLQGPWLIDLDLEKAD